MKACAWTLFKYHEPPDNIVALTCYWYVELECICCVPLTFLSTAVFWHNLIGLFLSRKTNFFGGTNRYHKAIILCIMILNWVHNVSRLTTSIRTEQVWSPWKLWPRNWCKLAFGKSLYLKMMQGTIHEQIHSSKGNSHLEHIDSGEQDISLYTHLDWHPVWSETPQ